MPIEGLKCVNCINMSGIEDGELARDFEYDFAEDALDFEVSIISKYCMLNISHFLTLICKMLFLNQEQIQLSFKIIIMSF